MTTPQIWSSVTAENLPVIVLKDGVFYGGAMEARRFPSFQEAIMDGQDPVDLLGSSCQQAALVNLSRVVADSTGDLVMECDGRVALKLPMHQAGIKIASTIEDAKGDSWQARIERKSRIGKAILSAILGLLFGAGLTWAYYGVITGKITRIHWLAAFLVNTLGPWTLLLLGGLIFLGGMAGFGYYLSHPAEVWTLEEE